MKNDKIFGGMIILGSIAGWLVFFLLIGSKIMI